MSTSVSVVVPVLDDARLLEHCLRRLDAQTRPPDEVIVVDNGSTDDSATVARSFGARVIREDRPGVTAASARGFDAAAGDVIARCDADSRVGPAWIARIASMMERNPHVIAMTGPAAFYDARSPLMEPARLVYLYTYVVSLRLMLGHHALFGSNCAVRASAWRAVSADVPRDDPEIHDDMDLSYRLPAGSRVLFDRALDAEISARPLSGPAALLRRLRRAGHTFGLHLPAQLPHRRRAER